MCINHIFFICSSVEHLGSLFKTTRIIYSARFPFCFGRRHVQKNQCGSPRFCVSKHQRPHCPVWRLCSRILTSTYSRISVLFYVVLQMDATPSLGYTLTTTQAPPHAILPTVLDATPGLPSGGQLSTLQPPQVAVPSFTPSTHSSPGRRGPGMPSYPRPAHGLRDRDTGPCDCLASRPCSHAGV